MYFNEVVSLLGMFLDAQEEVSAFQSCLWLSSALGLPFMFWPGFCSLHLGFCQHTVVSGNVLEGLGFLFPLLG